MMSESVRILYRDSKFFWRARCTVDILIVEHNAVDTLEVICHEGTTNQSADRMYFLRSILVAKFDSNELDDKLRLAKEAILRRHESPDENLLQAKILDTAITEYILCRLYVANFSSASFDMEFRLQAFDEKDSGLGGTNMNLQLREKPVNLIEYHPNLFQPLKAGEMEHALKDLEFEQRALRKECNEAALLEKKVRRLSLVKDRWRIPFVIAKVANGKRLSDSDSKLWLAAMEKVAVDEAADSCETGSQSAAETTNQANVAEASDPPADEPELEKVVQNETALTTIEQNETALTSTSQGRGGVGGALLRVKSNRWKDNSPSNRTTPKSTRKNSFSLGIAALQSSLQRTLGLSSKKPTFDNAVSTDTTTEHMLAAVGSDLESEAPSVVMVRRTPTAAESNTSLPSEMPAARSLMVAVAKHQESFRRGDSHSSLATMSTLATLSTVSTSPLGRAPSNSQYQGSLGSLGSLTPSTARRSSSRWTGERSRHNKAPSQQELRAKRILQKLELGDRASAFTVSTLTTGCSTTASGASTSTSSHTAGAALNICTEFPDNVASKSRADGGVRVKPVPSPVARKVQSTVVVPDCEAQDPGKFTETAPDAKQPPNTIKQFFQQIYFF